MRNRTAGRQQTDGLVDLLGRLIALQASMQSAVSDKLRAMRQADTGAMLAAARQEGELALQVKTLDEQRRQVVSKLCDAAGIHTGSNVAGVTLRMLMPHLSQSDRTRIAELADRLRQAMLRLAEMNQVAELVCREMQTHFKTMFAAMVQDDDSTPTYSADGGVGSVGGARVLDAVG